MDVGQAGLEQEYELYLQGKPGVVTEAVNPSGQVVRTVSVKPPRPGDSLVLNVDLGLEKDVSQSLANEIAAVRTTGKPAPLGAAVVLDPRNGQVLAMASYPSYDDNWWITGMTTALWRPSSRRRGTHSTTGPSRDSSRRARPSSS